MTQSAAATQGSQSAQSGRISLSSTSPAGPTGTLAAQTNWVYVADKGLAPTESYMVGMGYSRDDASGEWIPRKPVFYLASPLTIPPTPTTGKLEFILNFQEQSMTESSGYSGGISATLATVKVAAAHSQDKTKGSTGTEASVSLVYSQDWTPSMVTSPAQMILTPLAQQVLAMAEPGRSQAWQFHFGDYVAVGVGYRGHVGVKLSLSDESSFQTSSSFSSLMVRYGTASADVAIAEMAHEARLSQELQLSIDYCGDKKLQLNVPHADAIDTYDEQLNWINNLKSQATGSKRRQGLWLSPASSWWTLSNLDIPQFDDITLNTARQVTMTAMKSLVQAESYSKSVGQRIFLGQRYPAGSTESYDTLLQADVATLLTRFDEQWACLIAYMKKGQQTPANASALAAATAAVATANIALDATLNSIVGMVLLLPPMTTSVTDYFVQETDCGQGKWAMYEVQLQNAALFYDGSLEGIRQWLGQCAANQGQPETNSPLVVEYLSPASHGGQWIKVTPCTFSHGQYYLDNISIDHLQPMTGASEGLSNIRFRFRVWQMQCTTELKFTFRDMLGRTAPTWGPHDIRPGPSHP